MDLKLSLCITTYNRPELTIQAFEKVYNDPRIDHIIIVDDCSEYRQYKSLESYIEGIIQQNGIDKIRLYCNPHNIGMSRNKARALECATNDWCILFDSDNVLDTDYLDAFEKDTCNHDGYFCLNENDAHYIFCPDFAKPDFNYTKYSDISKYPSSLYGAKDSALLIKEDSFNCLMNTCNYVVNRDFYLKTYKYNAEHVASDTVWHNYNHLKNGGMFRVVQDMQYFHRVHKESGFMQNVDYNIKQAEKVRKLISELCS